MNEKKKKVLLVDLDGGGTVRDIPYLFKKAGCWVDVLCPKHSWLLKNNSFDRWIRVENSEQLVTYTKNFSVEGIYDWIILTDELSLVLLDSNISDDILASKLLPLIKLENRIMLGSKAGFYSVCKKYKFNTPHTVLYDSAKSLQNLVKDIPFPVLTKEDRGGGGNGIRYCKNMEELEKVLFGMPEQTKTNLVIQQYIQGDNISVEALYIKGKLLAYAPAKVLQTIKNGEFGPSSVRAYFFDKKIEDFLNTLGENVGINGFASVTLMRSEEGVYYIVEADLRTQMWFKYTVFVGVDFSDAIKSFLYGGRDVFRPCIPDGEVVIIRNFLRDMVFAIQKCDVLSILRWVFNIGGVWRFIPHYDFKVFVISLWHVIYSGGQYWFYKIPRPLWLKLLYQKVNNIYL